MQNDVGEEEEARDGQSVIPSDSGDPEPESDTSSPDISAPCPHIDLAYFYNFELCSNSLHHEKATFRGYNRHDRVMGRFPNFNHLEEFCVRRQLTRISQMLTTPLVHELAHNVNGHRRNDVVGPGPHPLARLAERGQAPELAILLGRPTSMFRVRGLMDLPEIAEDMMITGRDEAIRQSAKSYVMKIRQPSTALSVRDVAWVHSEQGGEKANRFPVRVSFPKSNDEHSRGGMYHRPLAVAGQESQRRELVTCYSLLLLKKLTQKRLSLAVSISEGEEGSVNLRKNNFLHDLNRQALEIALYTVAPFLPLQMLGLITQQNSEHMRAVVGALSPQEQRCLDTGQDLFGELFARFEASYAAGSEDVGRDVQLGDAVRKMIISAVDGSLGHSDIKSSDTIFDLCMRAASDIYPDKYGQGERFHDRLAEAVLEHPGAMSSLDTVEGVTHPPGERFSEVIQKTVLHYWGKAVAACADELTMWWHDSATPPSLSLEAWPGYDVNQPDPEGRSPIHHAAELGEPAICLLLLGAGAEQNVLSPQGHLPFTVAAGESSAAPLDESGEEILARIHPDNWWQVVLTPERYSTDVEDISNDFPTRQFLSFQLLHDVYSVIVAFDTEVADSNLLSQISRDCHTRALVAENWHFILYLWAVETLRRAEVPTSELWGKYNCCELQFLTLPSLYQDADLARVAEVEARSDSWNRVGALLTSLELVFADFGTDVSSAIQELVDGGEVGTDSLDALRGPITSSSNIPRCIVVTSTQCNNHLNLPEEPNDAGIMMPPLHRSNAYANVSSCSSDEDSINSIVSSIDKEEESDHEVGQAVRSKEFARYVTRNINENPCRLDVLVNPCIGVLFTDRFKHTAKALTSRMPLEADLRRAHDDEYLQKIKMDCSKYEKDLRALSSKKKGKRVPYPIEADADTPMTAASYDAARAAAGAVIDALDHVIVGGASRAFVAVRPPGHHVGSMGACQPGELMATDAEGSETKVRGPEVFDLSHSSLGSQGFCLLNNVAIGAAWAKYNHQHIRTIAIFDFDLHHGNGTEQIVRNLKRSIRSREFKHEAGGLSLHGSLRFTTQACWSDENDFESVAFLSTHGYTPIVPEDLTPAQRVRLEAKGRSHVGDTVFYPGTGRLSSNGFVDLLEKQNVEGHMEVKGLDKLPDHDQFILNVPLRPGSNSNDFREAIIAKIIPALRAYGPDIIILSAGFDAHHEDPVNGNVLRLVRSDFSWLTRILIGAANELCQGRLVSVLEGGYETVGRGGSPFARCVAEHVRLLQSTPVEAKLELGESGPTVTDFLYKAPGDEFFENLNRSSTMSDSESEEETSGHRSEEDDEESHENLTALLLGNPKRPRPDSEATDARTAEPKRRAPEVDSPQAEEEVEEESESEQGSDEGVGGLAALYGVDFDDEDDDDEDFDLVEDKAE